ncbi:ESX secretion-associated protein EspG [Amycolatopsis alkalitolerans]|uniref:ESX secretion-associated protein EspG n=1 Tax=Amycolatopsis alkalitolerans TaxID=2547244 RepID=A0A5C4M1M1_9PSEU|nr:ESX secretion-associated protein EspG [Amycolatopsis alkalitolerans]TNC23608.1 ESX secretion-associated protein EspG [Amycolatopsis alkalitolerans]
MARELTAVAGVVLSHLEYDLLWEDLDLGPHPYPLEVPSHGFTMAERDELGARVFETLSQARLIDEHEDVDSRLGEMLVLLARPELSVDAVLFGEAPLRMLAAAGRRQGVLAVLDEGELALRPCRPDEIGDLVAAVIGDAAPGPGAAVRLPREAFSAAMRAYAEGGYTGFERALSQAGITGRAVRALSTIVGTPRTASGQLAVNGPRGRSPIVSWYDTEAGRYGATVDDVAGGRWVTIAPANGAWMAGRIGELADRVTSG